MDDEALINCVRNLAARGFDFARIADELACNGIKITRRRVAKVLLRIEAPEPQQIPKRHDWTDKRIAFAFDLWRSGATGSEVANAVNKRFNTNFTRNAIVGKMHRLGAPPKSKPPLSLINARDGVSKPADRKERADKGKPKAAPAKAAKPPSITAPAAGQASLFLKRVAVDHSVFEPRPGRHSTACGAVRAIADVEGCRWPYGDPVSDKFHFCDAPQVCGSSYCSEHHAIAFTRVPGA